MQEVNQLLGAKADQSSCELLGKQSAPEGPASPRTSRVCEHGRIRYQCKDCRYLAAAEAEAAAKAEAEAAAAARTGAVAKAKAEAEAEAAAAEVEAKAKAQSAEVEAAAGEAKVAETEAEPGAGAASEATSDADAAAAEGQTSTAEGTATDTIAVPETTSETEDINPKTAKEAGANDDTSSGAALFKQYAQDTKAAGRAPVPNTNDPTDSSEVEDDKVESNAGSMFLTCSGLDAVSSRTAVILSATPS